jgi:hypothetical protein
VGRGSVILHGATPLKTGGSATELSATDAWHAAVSDGVHVRLIRIVASQISDKGLRIWGLVSRKGLPIPAAFLNVAKSVS